MDPVSDCMEEGNQRLPEAAVNDPLDFMADPPADAMVNDGPWEVVEAALVIPVEDNLGSIRFSG